jgi:uncharacterized protein YecT (DUF1311 family)
MLLSRLLVPALLLLPALPVSAASFDCAKAETPFEHAICDIEALSEADELLAKAFATATGGLTKPSLDLMRADQRNWLDYAQRACTDDAEVLTEGRYDADAGACLVTKFAGRSRALEQSRMLEGHRFLMKGIYGAVPDPDEAGNSESNWKVASHEMVFALLDEDDPLAEAFNEYAYARADGLSQTMISAEIGDLDPRSDSDITVAPKEVAGANRITLEANTYWYGHGAAHGNWTVSYLHYYVPEGREVEAADIFAGEDWAKVLAEAAWAELQTEHGEWLQVESADDIAELVIDPTRWDFSSNYGLIVQFQPYEVSAYAYGAPTITIPWDKLEAIRAETQDKVRYGY